MRKLSLLLIIILKSLSGTSQVSFSDLNYIYNPSFEIKKEGVSSIYSPLGLNNAQAYKLKHWKNRTLYELDYNSNQGNNFACCLHSPDWNLIPMLAHTQKGFVRMGYYEMIEQKLKKKLTLDRELLFTIYVRREEMVEDLEDLINLEILFGLRELTYEFEGINGVYPVNGLPSCDVEGYKHINDVILKYNNIIKKDDILKMGDDFNYFPVSFTFNIINEDIGFINNIFSKSNLNWLGINLSSEFRCLNDIIFIDDVSIIPSKCNECPVASYIQDENIDISRIIKAQEHIVVGSHIIPPINNVGSFGNVNIINNAIVSFEANNSVTLKPGVFIDLGANVEIKIKECEFTKHIDPLIATAVTGMTPDNDGINDDFVIHTNASDYIVQIYDRWGVELVNHTGQFNIDQMNTIVIPYNTDNWGSICVPTVYVWKAILSNCKETEIFNGNITVLPSCNSNKKEQFINNSPKKFITIKPNPVNKKLFIESIKFRLTEHNYKIFNFLGKEVNCSINEDNSINVNNLLKGIYHLILMEDGNTIQSLKFIKYEN